MQPHPVCQQIADRRRAKGWQQRELAAKAKLNVASIFNYETRIIPPLPKLERIAKALGCTMGDLLDGKS